MTTPSIASADWTKASKILAAHWGELSESWTAPTEAAPMGALGRRRSRSLPDLIKNSKAGTHLETRLPQEFGRSNSESKFVGRASLLIVPEAIRCGHPDLANRKDALECWLCSEHAAEPRQRLRSIVARRDPAVNAVALRSIIKGFCWTDLPGVVKGCDADRLLWPYIEKSFRRFVSRIYRERKPKGPPPLDPEAAGHLPAQGVPVDVGLARAQLQKLKRAEVSAFLTAWYRQEVARHAKGALPDPLASIVTSAPKGIPPGLDPNCTDCLQLWVLVLSLLDWSREDIARLIGKPPGYVGVLRTRAHQRLRAALTRQPIGLDYSKDRGRWGVLLSGWLLWDQVVDLSCTPSDLGMFTSSESPVLEMAEGWRHSGHVVHFRPNPRPTAGPTAIVFEDECVAGDAAMGVVLMNHARLTAGTGGSVAHAWVEVPPSLPGVEPVPLTLSAAVPGFRVTVQGATANLPASLKVPPRASSVDVIVQTTTVIPEPALVEVTPPAGVGGHHDEEVTAMVTLGSLLVAETATSRASGVLAIAPSLDAPGRIDLSSNHPSIARPLVDTWIADTAEFEVDVKTSRVSIETAVEIVAAGSTRDAVGYLTVRPPELRSVVFREDKLLAGAEVTGDVKFASPVSGPTEVRLAVKHGGVECRPPVVTVAAGQKSTWFTMRATDEARSGVAIIVASGNDSEASAKIKVVPNEVSELILDSDQVAGGASLRGSVKCLRPVGAPVQVRIGGMDRIVRVLATPVTILAGADSVAFEIETVVVDKHHVIEIFAEAFSMRLSKSLRIVPA